LLLVKAKPPAVMQTSRKTIVTLGMEGDRAVGTHTTPPTLSSLGSPVPMAPGLSSVSCGQAARYNPHLLHEG
jgi:hypothetical protein